MTEFKAPGPGLAAALVEAQKDMPKVTKDATADTGKFSYAYATLDGILAAVLPVLNKHGISLSQAPAVSVEHGHMLRTRLVHESGESQESLMAIPVTRDASAQAYGSALTYARRYAILSVLALAPGEDDDGAAAGRHEPAQRREGMPEQDDARATPKQIAYHEVLLKKLTDADPPADGQADWKTNCQTWMYETFQVKSRSQLSVQQMAQVIDWTEARLNETELPFAS